MAVAEDTCLPSLLFYSVEPVLRLSKASLDDLQFEDRDPWTEPVPLTPGTRLRTEVLQVECMVLGESGPARVDGKLYHAGPATKAYTAACEVEICVTSPDDLQFKDPTLGRFDMLLCKDVRRSAQGS